MAAPHAVCVKARPKVIYRGCCHKSEGTRRPKTGAQHRHHKFRTRTIAQLRNCQTDIKRHSLLRSYQRPGGRKELLSTRGSGHIMSNTCPSYVSCRTIRTLGRSPTDGQRTDLCVHYCGCLPPAEEGTAFSEKAAGQGHAYAMDMLGTMHYTRKEYILAGLSRAMFILGVTFRQGGRHGVAGLPGGGGLVQARDRRWCRGSGECSLQRVHSRPRGPRRLGT
jgi:hypothetical protein